MTKMPPAAEHLVRLLVLLPHDVTGPLWKSLSEDCKDHGAILSLFDWVGSTAKMWPEGAPRVAAEMALIAFDDLSDKTLLLLSQAIAGKEATGTGAGAAWATRLRETAIDVIAQHPSTEDIVQLAKDHWSL